MKLLLVAECSDKPHPIGRPLVELLRPFQVWASEWQLTLTSPITGEDFVITSEPDVQALRWLSVHMRMGRLDLGSFVGAAWGHDLIDPLIEAWDRCMGG